MIIPTGGSPTLDGRGCATSPPTPGRGEASVPTGGRGGLFRNREEDEEPPPTQRGGEDYPLTQGGANEAPPTGREEERTEDGRGEVSRTDQKNRRDVPTRAGNYAC